MFNTVTAVTFVIYFFVYQVMFASAENPKIPHTYAIALRTTARTIAVLNGFGNIAHVKKKTSKIVEHIQRHRSYSIHTYCLEEQGKVSLPEVNSKF
jgi:hypothetical protein